MSPHLSIPPWTSNLSFKFFAPLVLQLIAGPATATATATTAANAIELDFLRSHAAPLIAAGVQRTTARVLQHLTVVATLAHAFAVVEAALVLTPTSAFASSVHSDIDHFRSLKNAAVRGGVETDTHFAACDSALRALTLRVEVRAFLASPHRDSAVLEDADLSAVHATYNRAGIVLQTCSQHCIGAAGATAGASAGGGRGGAVGVHK